MNLGDPMLRAGGTADGDGWVGGRQSRRNRLAVAPPCVVELALRCHRRESGMACRGMAQYYVTKRAKDEMVRNHGWRTKRIHSPKPIMLKIINERLNKRSSRIRLLH